ncbi:hypothetical protein AMECASPLE_008378 [Ameca splendens]|uniref:Uncharacterized protein n=1 Tax=Ameca splendens TaxID=208324 RepID=A0ABV0YYI1_9TELE
MWTFTIRWSPYLTLNVSCCKYETCTVDDYEPILYWPTCNVLYMAMTNTARPLECIILTVKHSGISIMLMECFSSAEKGKLARVDGNMDGKYRTILEKETS